MYRTYVLDYEERGILGNRYLASVTLEGTNETKFNKSSFEWSDIPENVYSYDSIAGFLSQSAGDSRPYAADFNGDGLIDLCKVRMDSPSNPSSINNLVFFKNNGDNTFTYKTEYYAHEHHSQQQPQFGDFNGDGITDVLTTRQTDNGQWVADLLVFNKNFVYTSTQNIITQNYSLDYFPFQVGDFNGDGLSDVLLLAGSGCFIGSPTNPLSTPISLYCPYNQNQYEKEFFADFNGDGLTDVLVMDQRDGAYTGDYLWLNERTDWRWIKISRTLTNYNTEDKIVIGDYNGDMMSDFCVLHENGYISIFQSDGEQFICTIRDFPLETEPMPPGNDTEHFDYFTGDFNGDSRSDILISHYSYNHDDPQSEFRRDISIYLANTSGSQLTRLETAVSFELPRRREGNYAASIVADFNADGRSDILNSLGIGPSPNQQTWWKCYKTGFRLYFMDIIHNNIVSITNGLGVKKKISYERYIGEKRTEGEVPVYPVAYYPGTPWVVNSITSVGKNHVNITSYMFKSPRMHMEGKGFIGYLSTQTSTSLGIAVGSFNDYTSFEIDPDYFFTMPVYNRKWLTPLFQAEITISETYNEYDKKRYWDDIFGKYRKNFFPYLKKTLTKEYEIDGSFKKVSRNDYTFNNWGDMISSHAMQDDNSSLNLESYETQFEFREINTNTYYDPVITFDYSTHKGKWILGRMKDARVKQ